MTDSLFPEEENPSTLVAEPLAARMRPRNLDEYVGQQHLLGVGRPLRKSIESDRLHSMIFWGPPGVGKTSLAQTIAELTKANFIKISAVLAGVKDIRATVEQAKQALNYKSQRTVVFVDEVHRFNKSQQDAFLPHVEDGTLCFIGATTENPSFEVNNALLSRCRVYLLKSLENHDIENLIRNALSDENRGLGKLGYRIDEDALALIVSTSGGDGRTALSLLEMSVDLLDSDQTEITPDVLGEVIRSDVRRFDKGGDIFYEQISALHKSVRGSSPDAALYWCLRMLDGDCDPLYIARRVVRMATEDIGNADPRALEIALNAWNTQERLGSPEGELAIAQAVTYMACAPKSNAVYMAFKAAKADIANQPSFDVPIHLRNAPTGLMKNLNYGAEYRYAHDEPGAYAAGENYFPEPLANTRYYFPTDRGLEKKISDKLDFLRTQDEASVQQRYNTPQDQNKDD
ncbi:replication-associated recombination protein A [Sessilibacter corallicola]|uniref:Replication-associated recombination protein A n=1 Tax=Sessilibacter corallicola TaxID=2904075 RepID=A0ABQ0A9B9_9GAMM